MDIMQTCIHIAGMYLTHIDSTRGEEVQPLWGPRLFHTAFHRKDHDLPCWKQMSFRKNKIKKTHVYSYKYRDIEWAGIWIFCPILSVFGLILRR